MHELLKNANSPDMIPWLDHCPCLNEGRFLADKKENVLWEIIFVSITLFVMFAVLLSDIVGADWVMVTGLTLFMVTDIISLKEGLAGFSNEGLLTVMVLFVVADGISRTGALDWYMGKLLGTPTTIAGAQVRLMVPIATISAFLNNTPIVAIMIPITLRWAKQIGVPRQQLLIPLSYATILGGTCTLIGTSTNLVVVGLLEERFTGNKAINIGLFELGVYGVPVTIVGLAYILLVAPFFLPYGRPSKDGADPLKDADELFLGARLTPWSPAAGRTVKRSGLRDTGGIYLVSVHRAATGNVHRAVSPDFVLSVGDVLYFTGLVEGFGEFCEEHGLEVVTNEVKDTPLVKDKLDAATMEDESVPTMILDSPLHDDDKVGMTKTTMMPSDEAERLRRVNRMTDEIRGNQGDEVPNSPFVHQSKYTSAPTETGESHPIVVVTSDPHDRSVVIGIDAQDRAGLLLDISKALLRLNLQLRHTEAKVLGVRSLSIWRSECIESDHVDIEHIWSVLNALLETSGGIDAIKKRGLRVIRAMVTASSRLVGKTAVEVRFRETYSAAIVAVQKNGKNASTDVTFETGDVVILQAHDDSPLLIRPPEDFYEKKELPSRMSIANMMKLGNNKSRADLLSDNVDNVNVAVDGDTMDRAELGRPDLNTNSANARNEEVWNDLKVVFETSSSKGGNFQKEFLTAMAVPEGSHLVGKTVASAGISKLPGVFLVSIERPLVNDKGGQANGTSPNLVSYLRELRDGASVGEDDHSVLSAEPTRHTALTLEDPLFAGDILWFSGSASSVGDLRKIPGLQSYQNDEVEKLNEHVQERRLVQAVIARQGPLVGKTVKELRFRTQYGAAVIAVHREGNRVHEHPGKIKLQAGDVLLLEAGPTFISKNSENNRSFALLAEVDDSAPPRLRLFFVAIFLAVVMLGVHTITDISLLLCSLCAGIIMVLCGVLSQQEARDAVDWEIFVTIGAAFGISSALTNSGVAAGLANALVKLGTSIGIGDAGVFGAVYLATSLTSSVITNNAAAAILFPIAIEAALQTGVDLKLMSFTLMMGASDFMTPFGYTTNLMVYGPGGYSSRDFMLMGGPLQIVLWISTTIVISTSSIPFWISWLITSAAFIVITAARLTNGAIVERLKKLSPTSTVAEKTGNENDV